MKRNRNSGKPLLQVAWDIAYKAHRGQFRRDGSTPYFTHVKDVARRCSKLSSNTEMAAMLHDVLEDSGVTKQDLLDAGIPFSVVQAVIALTKTDDNHDAYLTRVKADPIARAVKIQDMLSNLSDDPTPNQIRKYAIGLLFLTEK
jgi:(p)ppGpp synthase/HD superfamily hydrolase